jgi:hypothetical protein
MNNQDRDASHKEKIHVVIHGELATKIKEHAEYEQRDWSNMTKRLISIGLQHETKNTPF